MHLATYEQDVLARTLGWIAAEERVRAALLTSSRADPTRTPDLLSDYDIASLVGDVAAMAEDERWVEGFGPLRLGVRDAETLSGAAVQPDDRPLPERGQQRGARPWLRLSRRARC